MTTHPHTAAPGGQTMSEKHTPGPWVLEVVPKSEWLHEDEPEWEIQSPSDEGVALMGNEPFYPWQSDNLADAALIAAAPDMLAALKAADAHFTGTFSENGTDHQQIRAAIAKAEAQSDV